MITVTFLYALTDARYLKLIRPFWATPGICWLPPGRVS